MDYEQQVSSKTKYQRKTESEAIRNSGSDLYVNIEPVSSGNLETVCMVLSQSYADTFEKAQVMPSGVSIMLTYKEPAWREDQSCLIRIDSFYLSGFDTNTETIEKYILDEVSKYQKKLQ